MKHRPKHVLEYLALRCVTGFVNLLPYRAALAFGWLLAALAHYVFRYRREQAMQRITEVLGEQYDPAELRRIAWRSWRNFIFSIIEMLRRRRMTLTWILSVADCEEGLQLIQRHAETGKGCLIATPHMGSWEMAGRACQLSGLRFFQIAARQKNPLVDRYWHELRSEGDPDDTVYRGAGAMRRVIRHLRNGRSMAILPDLRSKTEGVLVPFLGGQANVGQGVGMLANRGGIPVFPCICVRHGWTRHTFTAHPPIVPDPDAPRKEDAERITREVLAIMDRAIREHPDQWFWYNKRWVLDPLTP